MKIEIEQMMTSVVESMFPKLSDEKLGMLITVDCSYSKYSSNEKNDIDIRFPLYYLFQRPSNYTKVFFLETDDNFRSPPGPYDIIKEKELHWVLRSDHDSCWRSDGVRDLFRIENEVMDKHFGGYPITHEKVSIYNSIGGIYFVELEPFRIDREKSIQNVVVNKLLTMKEAAKLMPEK